MEENTVSSAEVSAESSVDAFKNMILSEDGGNESEVADEGVEDQENSDDSELEALEGEEISPEEEESEEFEDNEEEVLEEAGNSTASEKITVSGKEYQVTPEVAEAHKLMEKDYTRKTMELAEQKKGFEGELFQYQQNVQEVNNIAAFIFEDLNKPVATMEQKQALLDAGDTDALAELQLKEEAQKTKIDEFKQRAVQMNALLQKQEADRVLQARKNCAEILQKESPELLTEQSRKANTEFLKSFGISNERMQQIVEPEVFKIIDMARQFQESLDKAEKLKKEVNKAPRSIKNKGRVQAKNSKRAKLDAARQEVKKTGSAKSYFLAQELGTQ